MSDTIGRWTSIFGASATSSKSPTSSVSCAPTEGDRHRDTHHRSVPREAGKPSGGGAASRYRPPRGNSASRSRAQSGGGVHSSRRSDHSATARFRRFRALATRWSCGAGGESVRTPPCRRTGWFADPGRHRGKPRPVTNSPRSHHLQPPSPSAALRAPRRRRGENGRAGPPAHRSERTSAPLHPERPVHLRRSPAIQTRPLRRRRPRQ